MEEQKSALERACKAYGGVVKLSLALGLSRAGISAWGDKVPPPHVLSIERLTGVPRHELRPDLYPPEETRA